MPTNDPTHQAADTKGGDFSDRPSIDEIGGSTSDGIAEVAAAAARNAREAPDMGRSASIQTMEESIPEPPDETGGRRTTQG